MKRRCSFVAIKVPVRAPTAANLDTTNLTIDRDWTPLGLSASGAVRANLVFAGYGITAPEMHYDDYQGIDAKDKIVVVFRHEPQEMDPHSPFAGTNFTQHASFINKAINANPLLLRRKSPNTWSWC